MDLIKCITLLNAYESTHQRYKYYFLVYKEISTSSQGSHNNWPKHLCGVHLVFRSKSTFYHLPQQQKRILSPQWLNWELQSCSNLSGVYCSDRMIRQTCAHIPVGVRKEKIFHLCLIGNKEIELKECFYFISKLQYNAYLPFLNQWTWLGEDLWD